MSVWSNKPKKRKVPQPELIGARSASATEPAAVNTGVWRQRVLLWTAGALGLVFFGLAAYGPWFDVTDIEIRGTQKLDPASVHRSVEHYLQNTRWGIVPNRNLWLLSTSDLQKYLNDAISRRLSVDSIDVQKAYRHGVQIQIDERLPIALWRTSDRQGTMDKHGIIIELVSPEASSSLTIVDENEAAIAAGHRVLEESVVTSFRQLSQILHEQHIEFSYLITPKITCPPPVVRQNPLNTNTANANTDSQPAAPEINTNETVNTNSPPVVTTRVCDLAQLQKTRPEVHVQMKDGPRLLFDRFQNFDTAVATVQRLLGTNPPPTEYIDVRFGERAYVK